MMELTIYLNIPIWLEIIIGVVQVCFFITIAIISVLTFLKARKNLLNPIYAEVQKSTFNHLESIAQDLFEFVRYENRMKYHRDYTTKVVEYFHSYFLNNPKSSFKSFELLERIWLIEYHAKISTDPFIPSDIRGKVLQFLKVRIKFINDHQMKYPDEFIQKKKLVEPEAISLYESKIFAEISQAEYDQKQQPQDLLGQVEEMRNLIAEYLGQFDID